MKIWCTECNDELDEDTKPGEMVCNLCRFEASEVDPSDAVKAAKEEGLCRELETNR